MSLLKFKVLWEEDDNSYRDIEILSNQTFYEFHHAIKFAFQLPENLEASFFEINQSSKKLREISSTVEKNLRDAPALSMKKTPIGALLTDPHQRFIYECVHARGWTFLIETITLLPVPSDTRKYPVCTASEGISPAQLGIVPSERDGVMEIVEKYDLDNKDGYGDEGEEETASADDDMFDSAEDSNYTDDL